jgi:hypothetical protein
MLPTAATDLIKQPYFPWLEISCVLGSVSKLVFAMTVLKYTPPWRCMCALLCLAPVFVFGQSPTLPNIEPAATLIPATSAAGALLQPSEILQLTDGFVERLFVENDIVEFAKYFGFEYSTGTGDNDTQSVNEAACRTFPGDPNWPKDRVWDIFNLLLGGALIPTIPIAASCYDTQWGKKDVTECTNVVKNFTNPLFHHADPTSNMWPIFQGRTCMPTNDSSTKTCTLGGYPEYAVKVTNVAQIQLAINFARAANLRLVIKNTGHCYLGKSTGAGALSLWMHNMNKIDYLPDYKGPGYSGPALKLAAGVTVREVYEAADRNGVTVLGAVSWVRPSLSFRVTLN